MDVHIVYAHPSERSFSHALLTAFVRGLDAAGHRHTVSDLYAMGFNPVLSTAEYERESAPGDSYAVPDDVRAEQAKLDAADVWCFIYPVWWTDCPAILKGWFDRVWTAGWAYHPETLVKARAALVMCTAGNTEEQLEESGRGPAMRTVMLADRIFDRAAESSFQLFGGSTHFRGEEWTGHAKEELERAFSLGRDPLGTGENRAPATAWSASS